MTLEEALLAAAAKGLTYLSLHPVHSEDNKTVYWRCSATPSTMHKYVSTQALNPVDAMLEVLKVLPKAPSRSKPVTAAVNPSHPLGYPDGLPLDKALRPGENIGSTTGTNLHARPLDEIDPPAGELDQWLPKA